MCGDLGKISVLTATTDSIAIFMLCSSLNPVGEEGRHHAWSCPQALVPCTHASRGCAAIVPRIELDTHVRSCLYTALSGWFEQSDARDLAQEQRTSRIEAKVAELGERLIATAQELAQATRTIAILRAVLSGLMEGTDGADPTAGGARASTVASSLLHENSEPAADRAGTMALDRLSLDEEVPESWLSMPRSLSVGHAESRGRSHSQATRGLGTEQRTDAVSPENSPTSPVWAGITHRAAADIQASSQPPQLLSSPDLLNSSLAYRPRSFADDVISRLPTGLPVNTALPALIESTARLAAEMDRMERRGQM